MAEIYFEQVLAAANKLSPDEKRKLVEELKKFNESQSSDSGEQTVRIMMNGNR